MLNPTTPNIYKQPCYIFQLSPYRVRSPTRENLTHVWKSFLRWVCACVHIRGMVNVFRPLISNGFFFGRPPTRLSRNLATSNGGVSGPRSVLLYFFRFSSNSRCFCVPLNFDAYRFWLFLEKKKNKKNYEIIENDEKSTSERNFLDFCFLLFHEWASIIRNWNWNSTKNVKTPRGIKFTFEIRVYRFFFQAFILHECWDVSSTMHLCEATKNSAIPFYRWLARFQHPYKILERPSRYHFLQRCCEMNKKKRVPRPHFDVNYFYKRIDKRTIARRCIHCQEIRTSIINRSEALSLISREWLKKK